MGRLRCDGLDIEARPGVDLLSQVLDGGGNLPYLCMAGSCRTCRVQVQDGIDQLEPPDDAEVALAPGERLACQAVYRGPGDVTCSSALRRRT